MNGFDRLERELELAARRRRPSWWRRAAGAGGAVAITVALASVAVIAVGAVVLLHGRRSEFAAASSAQPAPAAQRAAWARALSCGGNAPLSRLFHVRATSGAAPSPRLLALVGALRGAWTPADAAPAGTCLAGPLPATFDVAYARYVGPGLHGGKVFMVPGTLVAPRLRAGSGWTAYAPLRLADQPVACLVATGGGLPAIQRCALLQQIERPLAFAIAGTPFTRFPAIPLSVARMICSHQPAPEGRSAPAKRVVATCIANARHPHLVAPQPQVVYGVVRDGVATVDVYSQSGRKLLASVPVHDNVYVFQGGGATTGFVKLVFKDSNGRVVPSTPADSPTRIAKSLGMQPAVVGVSSSVVGTISASPPPATLAARIAAQIRAKSRPGAMGTMTVAAP